MPGSLDDTAITRADEDLAEGLRDAVRMMILPVEEIGTGGDANKVRVRMPGEEAATADLALAEVFGSMPTVGQNVLTLLDSTVRRVISGGTSPGGGGSDPAGTVKMFAGSAAPSGYLICNGAVYDPVANPDLFAAIGTTYGGTAGSPLLPDFRGRAPVGAGTGDAADATAWALAQKRGEEGVALTTAQLAAHDHGGSTGTGGTHTHDSTDNPGNHQHQAGADFVNNSPTSGSAARWTTMSPPSVADSSANTSSAGGHTHSVNSAGSAHAHTISSAGSGNAHENLQPSLGINFIIKT